MLLYICIKRELCVPTKCIRDVEGFTMAEISVQFKNKINGYDKVEVQEYAKGMEAPAMKRNRGMTMSQRCKPSQSA